MKQQYAAPPDAVEVHRVGRNTDVILRKNIEAVTRAGDIDTDDYIVYECDEMQFRYAGALSKEEVASDFNIWWNYQPLSEQEEAAPDRIASLETQITDLQVALCEVYELLG